MANKCIKPMQYEHIKFELGINTIINEMFANQKRIIYKHIKKFLDVGGTLESLTFTERPDGTLILRSNERTIVTVRVQIDGRKIGGVEFTLTEEPALSEK